LRENDFHIFVPIVTLTFNL